MYKLKVMTEPMGFDDFCEWIDEMGEE